ncbi:hypothetical protein BKA70DRAFT_1253458 [Coprinopsis sp. MPI-PUGE-AT-0042]|nr:hypothetical protein BKA70DRAFT_1253458 [Coprinopsis sp. MPI-PUGE-AT-0042]
MFNKIAALTSVLFAASALVRAEVTPSEPGPGSSYTAGETCTVSWDGDRDSDTIWKDMSIQLMTGDNFNMVHLSTIASDLDGTISGRFNYPCPEVIPYSTIYFYQFTSPHTDVKTWATRFTITSPEGESVPPENDTQPGTNAPIPWGVGALADPSIANPPPVIGGETPSGSASPSGASNAAAESGSASLPSASAPSGSLSASPSASGTRRPTSSSSSPAGAEPSDNGAAASSSTNFKLVAVVVSAVSLFFMA